MRLYAMGDVHGQLDMLTACHARIAADRERTGDATAPVVHLGDYCDRGPRTKDVLEFLIQGQAAGQPWICLKGNHDRMMWLYLQTPPQRDPRLRPDYSWGHEQLGGTEALRSYGIDRPEEMSNSALHNEARAAVPSAHVSFLGQLETFYTTEHLFLCHAGIRPGVALTDQAEDDLIWIRGEFLNDTTDHGKLVVHGHSPVREAEHAGNRVNLDTGAGFGRPMTVAVFEERDVWLLTDEGRVPLYST